MIGSIDTAVYGILLKLHTPLLNWLWVFLAKFGIYIVILISLYIFFKQKGIAKRFSFLFQSLFVLLLSRGLVTSTVAFFYHRQRPFETGLDSLYTHGGGDSFPSGHAVSMFSFAFVIYAWNKKAGMYAFILSALSGISRAIAGVHWISDVIAGFLVAWVVYILLRKFVFAKSMHLSDLRLDQNSQSE